MSATASGSFTATSTAATGLALSRAGEITKILLGLTSVTGATVVTFSVYDNNVAASTTTAAGATWSGKSPGYTGSGPNTAGFTSQNLQSDRYGDQQSQTAPNGSGVRQYWQVTDATGVIDYTAAPGDVDAGPFSGLGSGTFASFDSSGTAAVSAVTAATLLYRTTLVATGSYLDIPLTPVNFKYGLNIVIEAADMSAATATYTINYNPLPL